MEEFGGKKNPKSYPDGDLCNINPMLGVWLANKRGTEQNLGEMVEEFHRKFGMPVCETSSADIPRILGFRTDTMLDEEITELNEAVLDGNDAEILDALADIIYVAAGTAVEIFGGRTLDIALQRVHKSNMTKDTPETRGGKGIKGPDFKPVELADLVEDE